MARVLLAEDDPDIREAVAALLADLGHDLVWVDQVETARAAFEQRRPDLAMIDLDLHGSSSQPLIEAWTELPDPPAIVIISASPKEAREIGIRFGVCVVTKPFGVSTLIEAIGLSLRMSNPPSSKA